MVRKPVPDWLNSSLWATTPTADDRLHRYSTSPTTTTASAAVYEPTLQPPSPLSPPSTASKPPSTPPKSEIRDPLNKNSYNNNNDQNGDSSGVSPDDISRQAQLLAELFKKVINIWELRRIASQGISDGAGIRSTAWKLLLGYLPPDRAQWSSELAKKRSQYRHFKEELLMNPLVRNHKEVGEFCELRQP